MKKSIIAISVMSALSTAAFAQSNVTVYGIVDAAGVYQSSNTGRSSTAVSSGGLAGSRLGFRGTEDLGNGTQAFFTIEEGFNVDTDASRVSRQTFVGLKNTKAGSISLGRQYSPGYNASFQYDALAASPFSAVQILAATAGFTAAANSNGRWNNTVQYVSPVLSGLETTVMYRTGEQVNSTTSTGTETHEGYGVGFKYVRGALATSYVFQHTESSASGAAGAGSRGNQDEHFVGASYDFGAVKALASYQNADWSNNGGQGSYNQLTSVGVIVPVSARADIHANYAYLNVDGGKGGAAKGQASGDANSTSVAGVYKLSPRTRLYALVNYTDTNANLRVSNYGGSAVGSVAANQFANSVTAGTTVATGISHAF